jgi:hypothetical protein
MFFERKPVVIKENCTPNTGKIKEKTINSRAENPLDFQRRTYARFTIVLGATLPVAIALKDWS